MRPRDCWVTVLIASSMAVISRADDALPPEALDRVKSATVLVKSRNGAQSATGFLIHVNGNAGLIVTGRQIAMQGPITSPPKNSKIPPLPPKKAIPFVEIDVVFNSGTADQVISGAKVVAIDNFRDIALLRVVRAKGMPAPFDLPASVPPTEPTAGFVVGFPSTASAAKFKRNPELKVRAATVSNARDDGQTTVMDLEIDEDIGAAGAGSPVVDAKGRLIGVAVSKGSGGRRVILARDLFNARVVQTGVRVVNLEAGAADVEIRVRFIDPLKEIVKAFVAIVPADEVKESLRADANGRFPPLPNAQTIELKYESQTAIGAITLRSNQKGPVNYYVQPSFVKSDQSLTRAGVGAAQAVDFNGPKVRSITAGALRSPPSLCWSDDASAFYHLDGSGTVRRFGYPNLKEEAVNVIGCKCNWISPSFEGLIATLPESGEACLLDPKTLAELKRIGIGKAQRVISAPKFSIAYAADDSLNGGVLTVLDLKTGKPIKEYRSSEFEGRPGFGHPVVAPDGQSLFTVGSGKIFRFKLSSAEVTLADATDAIIVGRCQGLSISNDGDYVAAPSFPGNQWVGTFATYVYASANLKKPASIIASGAHPQTLGFDFKSGLIYAHNVQSPLIAFDLNGVKQRDFALTNSATWVRTAQTCQFLVHPGGRRLLALCETGPEGPRAEPWIFSVELPAGGWGTLPSLDSGVAVLRVDLLAAVSEGRQLEKARAFAQAETQFEKALSLAVKMHGENHAETEAILNNLSTVYSVQKKYADAETVQKRRLAILEARSGPDDFAVAIACRDLGELSSTLRKHVNAEAFYKRSLAIHEKQFGRETLAVASALADLAKNYEAQGKPTQSEPLRRRCLAIQEKVLGNQHLEVATSLNRLGILCKNLGNFVEAESLLRAQPGDPREAARQGAFRCGRLSAQPRQFALQASEIRRGGIVSYAEPGHSRESLRQGPSACSRLPQQSGKCAPGSGEICGRGSALSAQPDHF